MYPKLVDVVKDNVASLSIAVLYLLGQMDAKGMNKERTEKNNVETFKSLERDENKRKKKKKKYMEQNNSRAQISNRRQSTHTNPYSWHPMDVKTQKGGEN